MPGAETYPEYLPGHAPKSTTFAALNDLAAIPYLTDDQKEKLYRGFLAAPLPRAIAIGMSNGSWASGGFDPASAALKRCWQTAQYCQLYAVDNTVSGRVSPTRRRPPHSLRSRMHRRCRIWAPRAVSPTRNS